MCPTDPTRNQRGAAFRRRYWEELEPSLLRGPDLLPSAVGLPLRSEDFPGHAAKTALPFEAPRMTGLNPHVVILTRSEALFVVLSA